MLRQYEAALLVLESDPGDAEQLNAAFRAAHTIKGGAGMFGFEDVVRFTHVAETLLDALRDGRRQMDGDCMDALLQSRDQIEALLAEIRPWRADRRRRAGLRPVRWPTDCAR